MEPTIELRRTLHEWPELGNDLPITRDTVMSALDGLPLDVTLHESTSGIAALLEGSTPGPTMLLRGDMDALEMPEDTGLEFSSRIDGVMHACGHDTAHRHARRRRQDAVASGATSSPGVCCSCSSPAKRATTALGSCSTKACSTSAR